GEAVLCDAAGKRLAGDFPPGASAADFSPDGGRLLVTGGRSGRLYEAETGKEGGRMDLPGPAAPAEVSPGGGSTPAPHPQPRLRLQDLLTGSPLGTPFWPAAWPGPALPDGLAWACGPDGKTALLPDRKGAARLWDLATGQPLGSPLPGVDAATAVFTVDG